MKSISLYELTSMVSETIADAFDSPLWIQAELSEIREVNGHCYMNFVQKDVFGNTPVARASAKCWKNVWSKLHREFEIKTGQILHPGMKLLFQAMVEFHPTYGFSLILLAIDAAYSMGEMLMQRQLIIEKLKQEGVYDLQHLLCLSPFAQNIAVISSEGAAGYGDFCNQLTNNSYGVLFKVTLFPAVMQGEAVAPTIVNALNCIAEAQEDYDCVVIIRGGGAVSDMSGFDSFLLAENVANFPLPVITGIGHDRDECVIDMISFRKEKTPTAVAAYLLDNALSTLQRLDGLKQSVLSSLSYNMERERLRLSSLEQMLPGMFELAKQKGHNKLEMLWAGIKASWDMARLQQMAKLNLIEQKCDSCNPELLLEKGYSMTLLNGRLIKNLDEVKPGDMLVTRLASGKVLSQVVKVDKNNDK